MGDLRLGEAVDVRDPLIGTTLAGRYRLDALLGRGGMGRVYRAYDTRLDRDVALKILVEDVSHDAGIAARFVREAKVLARLSYKHVLQVFDHGETEEGRLFLVTELLRGESLADLLRGQEGRRLSPRATAELLLQIAMGLDRVHAEGVIHRDLKPANIFVESDEGRPHIKILDFGIARRTDSHASGSTGTGLIGTPAYMSPEQVRSEVGIDARTDLYSLGIIAYECLTSRPPFVDESSWMNVVMAHMNTAPAPLAQAFPGGGLAEELRGLVEQLLAKDPTARPASAREVRTRLEALLAAGTLVGEPLEAPGEDTTRKPLDRPRSMPTPTPEVRPMAAASAALSPPRTSVWRWVGGGLGAVAAAAAVLVWASAQVRAPQVEPVDAPSAEASPAVVATPASAAPAPAAPPPAASAAAEVRPTAEVPPSPPSAPIAAPAEVRDPPRVERRRAEGRRSPSPSPTASAVAEVEAARGAVIVEVRDADGSKLDVEIQVEGQAGRWPGGAAISLAPGRYALLVRRVGEYLQVKRKQVTVEPGAPKVVRIVLD
jgi:serine/threonine-protein kinase